MKQLLAGTIHATVPSDLRTALRAAPEALTTWEAITPLARNEWICWIESAKLPETKRRRIERAQVELAEDKHRPCCWIGCIHRTDKAISPSVRGILKKHSR